MNVFLRQKKKTGPGFVSSYHGDEAVKVNAPSKRTDVMQRDTHSDLDGKEWRSKRNGVQPEEKEHVIATWAKNEEVSSRRSKVSNATYRLKDKTKEKRSW